MAEPARPIGVLLVQLGTPDAPTKAALRRYLRQFLGDPRVLDVNPLLRWFLLNVIILPFRPKKSAAMYQRVWTDRGSPLLLTSEAQARGLAERLGAGYRVELGMRYGNPSVTKAIEALIESGYDRILVFPLFPQYSSATTASVYDAVFDALGNYRSIPTARVVPPFYDDPGYIDAVAEQALVKLGDQLDDTRLLISFHGVPKRFVELDPYQRHCEATGSAIAKRLGLKDDRWSIAYQSRFGPEEWLQPYTDDELERIAKDKGDLAVMCPGFVADCLETIDEIGSEGEEVFQEAGGGELILIPCVNDHPRWLDAMADIVRRETAGWDGER